MGEFSVEVNLFSSEYCKSTTAGLYLNNFGAVPRIIKIRAYTVFGSYN